MTYKFIKDFKIGEEVNQTFLLADVERRTTQKGKPFARMTLKDKTGQINANVWDLDINDYPEFKPGIFVALTIEVQDYRGSKSAVSRAVPMPVSEPDDLSFYQDEKGLTDEVIESYYSRLMEYKGMVENPYIKAYLDVIFEHNEGMVKAIKIAPASATNRGAYKGGLVEHVYKVMLNAEAIIRSQREANRPAPIDTDIVIAGVLVHDIGKAYSYKVDITGSNNTRSGSLLQHLPMSYGLSVQAFIQAESMIRKAIPEEIKDHINHIILSHHGVLEYGSPVTPQSIEAQIVHVADMSDSTVSNFAEPTVDNRHQVFDDGFVEGTYFSSKRLFVGKNETS